MRSHQRSRTADAAAAVRASHRLYDRPVVFDDPLALALTSAGWRLVCRNRFLHWLVLDKAMGALRPIAGQILSRARYAEDCLEEAVVEGIDQYVIIGAGLDSFALRRPDLASRLGVFELDHPDTQRAKRDRLRAIGHELPARHEFVSIDFETESVGTALARSSFASGRRAFFSWLGTVPYLSEEAVYAVLAALASLACAGSEVVLDYTVPDELVDATERRAASRLRRFTSRRGEPLVSAFDPTALCDRAADLGYRVRENLSPAEQNRRYFSGRSDGLSTSTGSWYLRLGVAA